MYKIATVDKQKADSILASIYKECPDYWPEGLNGDHMDDLYVVKDASTNEDAGFIGWQEFFENNKDTNKLQKVGYYVIGILPEHRSKGFAKEAVSKIIEKKADCVDKVKASIVDSNKASLALASSLNVPVRLQKTSSQVSFTGAQNLASRVKEVRKNLKDQGKEEKAEQEKLTEQEKQQQIEAQQQAQQNEEQEKPIPKITSFYPNNPVLPQKSPTSPNIGSTGGLA